MEHCVWVCYAPILHTITSRHDLFAIYIPTYFILFDRMFCGMCNMCKAACANNGSLWVYPKVQGLMNYGQIVPPNASSQSKMSQSHIRNDFTHFEYGFGIFVIGVKRFEALSVHSPLILALWGTPAVTLGNRRAGETY